MRYRNHYHRLTSSIAGILTFLILAIGSLQITSAQTRIISLSGDLDFGRVPLHSSSQRLLAISNLGDSVLTVSNLNYPLVPLWGQASFQGNWSGTIPPNSTQYVYITFTPMGSGIDGDTNDVDIQGYLSVESDATAGANYFFMSGVGTWSPLPPILNLNFGRVPIGTFHGFILNLTNIGNAPVTISNVFVPDGFFAGFPNTIAPGARESLSVEFEPTTVTDYAGNVSISSDATDPALVVLMPNGNLTNSPSGFSTFPVSGAGAYPGGKFEGLFMSSNNPAFESSGYFTADSTTNGELRATITLAGKRYPFSAQVSSSGTVTATIVRKKLPALNVSLLFGGFNRAWTGTIDDGAWTAELTSEPATLLSKQSLRAVPAGKYTINLAGSTNALLAPTASGTGTISVRLTDATHVTGVLGDGTRYSQNTFLCNSHLPFYASLSDNRGAILGWIGFVHPPPPPPHVINPAPLAAPELQIVGTLHWFKPAGIDFDYPDGFSFQTTVSGSVPQ
jgi:hypothetical protein